MPVARCPRRPRSAPSPTCACTTGPGGGEATIPTASSTPGAAGSPTGDRSAASSPISTTTGWATPRRTRQHSGPAYAETGPEPGCRCSGAGDRLDELSCLLVVEVLGDVGLADDADQFVAVDHRESPDLVLGHRPDRLLDRVIGTDGDRLPVSEGTDRGVGEVLALGDRLDDDVAVGDH